MSMRVSGGRKLWVIAAVITAAALTAVALWLLRAPKPKDDNTIRLGVIAPLTGELASYGERERNAFLLALDEVNNEEGGINGKKLELIIEDSRTEAAAGVLAAEKLIDHDKVPAIVGETSSSITLAIAPVAERNKVVLLTPISSADSISQAGDYVFRLAPYDSLLAKTAATWIRDMGYANAGVIFINNAYGRGLHDAFQKTFTELGGKVVTSEEVNAKTRDFKAQLAKIKEAKPDVIFAPLYVEEGAVMLRQRTELAIAIPVVGTDPFHDPKVIELAKGSAEGLMFIDVSPGSGAVWDRFRKDYQARFHSEPDIVAAESYDAVKLLAHVLRQTGPDAGRIKDALYGLTGYTGAIGPIKFDANGDNITKTFYKYKIEQGKYIELGP